MDAEDPLDLLKRFTATPFSAVVRWQGLDLLIETNEEEIVRLTASLGPPVSIAIQHPFAWKLLRDTKVIPTISTHLVLAHAGLMVAALPQGILCGVDLQSNELLAFIGADVPLDVIQQTAFPFFLQLIQSPRAVANSSRSQDNCAHRVVLGTGNKNE